MWFSVILSLVVLAALLFLLYKLLQIPYKDYWTKRGIFQVDTSKMYPLWKVLTFQVSFLEYDRKISEIIGDRKFGGYVEMFVPVLYVKDLDLLKQILVKDFDHFVDRRKFDFGKVDEVFSKMLVSKRGREWKDLRSIMSPAFTTGKIRRMFPNFNTCGNELAKYLKEVGKSGEPIDFQDAFGRYTLETIATIVFGVRGDSLTKKDSTFRSMAKRMQNLTFWRLIKFIILMITPKLAKISGLSITEQKSFQFFSSIMQRSMKERREHDGLKHNDFLQMMMEAQAGQLRVEENEFPEDTYERDAQLVDSATNVKRNCTVVLDDATVLSQCFLFFAAGFDTIESLLTFTAYELAINPAVQEKLATEVKPVLDETGGSITYDSLQSLPYLDMVVCEILRLHPPSFLAERECTQDYLIPETKIVLPKGTRVLIPINSIHHDARYYPYPDKFNPENFSAENKAKRHPYAFLPFGQGPRNCIAMRFALIETKAAVGHLVYNFKIEPSEKTQIPVKISNKSGIKKPADGMWLKFSVRTH